MRKKIRNTLLYMLCGLLFCTAFTACDKDVHDGEYFPGAGQEQPDSHNALVVGLQSETHPEHLSLYIFGSDGNITMYRSYTDPQALASDYFPLEAGSYTVMVVANVPEEELPKPTVSGRATEAPEELTPSSLAEWLNENGDAYPDLLTASEQIEVKSGVTRMQLTLEEGTDGMAFTQVRLLLSVPGKGMSDYTSTRAASTSDTWQFRCRVEVCRKSTENRIYRRASLCTPQADGRYAVEIPLQPGEYDIRLWADWTDDGTTGGKYYAADDLHHVTVRTDGYTAGEATDTKDAYYANRTISASGEAQDESVVLVRPFARYRLVATDVEGYETLRQEEGYPPMENLDVRVTYTGYFPTGFDAVTGKPNDSQNTGIAYTTRPVAADGYDTAKARQVGADFVLTNGEESFVTATIRITDRTTGKAVSAVQNVKIPYRRGHLTTVKGDFLTAGNTSGGVDIDTDWDDEIIVDF